MTFVMTSPAFANQQAIPTKYVRKGQNISPPLVWRDPPSGTRSFVLIVEDPDAPGGTFRHWAIYDIPAGAGGLPEGAGVERHLPQAVNDFGHARYDGPEPPQGSGVHHYIFRLAALDVEKLIVPERSTVAQVWLRAAEHALGEASLTGMLETRG